MGTVIILFPSSLNASLVPWNIENLGKKKITVPLGTNQMINASCCCCYCCYCCVNFSVRFSVYSAFFRPLVLRWVTSNYKKHEQWKTVLYTLLISRGPFLNIKFMTSFAESTLSSCADFITLDPCLIARHQMSSSKEELKKGQYLS